MKFSRKPMEVDKQATQLLMNESYSVDDRTLWREERRRRR
jgi:hypothetical protein